MLKIAAHARAIRVNVERRLGGIRKMVAEGDVRLHPIAYRLDARPSRLRISEQRSRIIKEAIYFAVPRREKISQSFRRQIFHRNLAGIGTHGIWRAGVFD